MSTTYLAIGSPTTNLSEAEVSKLVTSTLTGLGQRHKVLAIPPDFTRANSRAGIITDAVAGHYGDSLRDILPALGTHAPMSDSAISRMYPGSPKDRFRVHDWRNEVVTIGELPASFVKESTGGLYDKPWPAQLNRLIWQGGHDLILSIGQVVPHEVVGIANHTKNLFVGCGGKAGIDESHFIGACYGMERMMGRADTPVRRLLNESLVRFCGHLPIIFVLTVVGKPAPGERADTDGLVTRGLFIGSGTDCFDRAAKLSVQVNFIVLDEEPQTMVVHLDPEEFHTTWLGNKSIYRTRMAIADGGELIVLAPGLRKFGEDPGIDTLIRRYGYRTTPEIMAAVAANPDLQGSLSAAAHLIHGSSEGRFKVTYCTPQAPGFATPEEIRSVGYAWAAHEEMSARYNPATLNDGWNTVQGRRIFYISNPALGLWAYRGRL